LEKRAAKSEEIVQGMTDSMPKEIFTAVRNATSKVSAKVQE